MVALEERGSKEPPEKEGRPAKQRKQKKSTLTGRQPLPVPKGSQPTQILVDEVSSLREQLRQEQERSKEHLNKLLYVQADFENYRRRLNQEVESRIDAGKARLIQNLLAIVDELELALNAAKNAEGASAVANGLEIVLKKFSDLLTAEGLSAIESVGKKFDPTTHEAVERVPCDDKVEGTILEEIRKGFTIKGKLIRPSIVKIAVPHIAEPDNSKPIESGPS
jgi:molecular chaperone GrpE